MTADNRHCITRITYINGNPTNYIGVGNEDGDMMYIMQPAGPEASEGWTVNLSGPVMHGRWEQADGQIIQGHLRFVPYDK